MSGHTGSELGLGCIDDRVESHIAMINRAEDARE
jgi:hypothetical protein